jgi:hypothetical protein
MHQAKTRVASVANYSEEYNKSSTVLLDKFQAPLNNSSYDKSHQSYADVRTTSSTPSTHQVSSCHHYQIAAARVTLRPSILHLRSPSHKGIRPRPRAPSRHPCLFQLPHMSQWCGTVLRNLRRYHQSHQYSSAMYRGTWHPHKHP